MPEQHAASRIAARIAAAAGVVIAVVGLILVLGGRPESVPDSGPESRADAVGTAMQTIVGGALLVTGALAGMTAVLIWLVSQRRARRLR